MNILKSISKNEWWFVGLIAGIIIIFTTIPFVYGYVKTPANKYFTGIHSLAPGDYYVYFSNILQTYDGHILFKDLYATESGQYNIINTFWNFSGIVGKIFSLSPLVAFHAARILTIPILLFSLYFFASYFYPVRNNTPPLLTPLDAKLSYGAGISNGIYQDVLKRKALFLFLCFSTGIGAYFEQLFSRSEMIGGYYSKPMDLWVAESNIFLSMLHSGHMVLSLAMLVFIFLLYLLALEKNKYLYSAISGILLLLLLSFHPFLFPVIIGVLAAYVLFLFIAKREHGVQYLYHLGIILLLSLPMLLYYGYMMMNDVVTQERANQNINLTTQPALLILSYGFLFVCGVGGVIRFFKKKEKDEKMYFLFIWLMVQGIIIYLPLNFQRRMIEGLSIPLIFFAFEYMLHIYSFIQGKMKNIFITKYVLKNPVVGIYIAVILFFPSNLFVWARDIALYVELNPAVYFSQKDISPIFWLKEQSQKNIQILADVNSSYFIPGVSAKAVFAGHAVETPYFIDKEKMVNKFFKDNGNDDSKMLFLQKYKITHIYYGWREKKLGSYRPDEKKYLSKEFDNGEAAIYKVNF